MVLEAVYKKWKAAREAKKHQRAAGSSPEHGDHEAILHYAEDAHQSENSLEAQEAHLSEHGSPSDTGEVVLKGDTSHVRKVSPAAVATIAGVVVVAFLAAKYFLTAEKPVEVVSTEPVIVSAGAGAAAGRNQILKKDTDTAWLEKFQGAGGATASAATAPVGASANSDASSPLAGSPESTAARARPAVDLRVPSLLGGADSSAASATLKDRNPSTAGSVGRTSPSTGVEWTMDDVKSHNFEKDPGYANTRMSQVTASLAAPAVVYTAPPKVVTPQSTAQAGAQPAAARNAGQGDVSPEVLARQQLLQSVAVAAPGQYLPSLLAPPVTKYLVKVGTAIPVVLRNSLNTDLPGAAYGMVTRNIYDSATGKYLLIPQGTVVMGPYQAATVYGKERLLVAWTRMDYPNGVYFDLKGQPSIDFAGMAGIAADVDNHYFKTLSSALMMSVIGAVSGTAIEKISGVPGASSTLTTGASTVTTSQPLTAAQSAASNMATYFSQVSMKIVEKGMGLGPTLTVPAGEKMSVGATADLILAPYTP